LADPFETRSEESVGAIGRVLGGARRQAMVEVENLLAGAARVADVSAEQIADIAKRHGVDLAKRLAAPRRDLYRRYLEHCLIDQVLSTDEVQDLAHLRALLQLPGREVLLLHDDVISSVYGSAIDDVLEDCELDEDEKAFLERLRADLRLSDEDAQSLYEQRYDRARQRYLSRVQVHNTFTAGAGSLDLEGSGETIEKAAAAAVEKMRKVAPSIHLEHVSLHEAEAQLDGERIIRWNVKLRSRGRPADEGA
jgi:hypothetical protein